VGFLRFVLRRNTQLDTLIKATSAGGFVYDKQSEAVVASACWMKMFEAAAAASGAGPAAAPPLDRME
jgi:hypothetical protein